MEIRKRVSSIIKYFSEDIWKVSSRHADKKQFFFIRLAQIFILAVRGFIKDGCSVKASALTYYSLFSIVPLAAMAFGIAKGFGFEKNLEEQLQTRFAGQEDILIWVTNFADKYLLSIKGGMIAGIGAIFLMWSVMNLLGSIEASFNDIWDIKRARSFIRKFSDYISLTIIAVLFLVSSGSMIVFINQQLQGVALISNVGSILFRFIPVALVWIVFTLLLYIMPNTKVKFSAALFGGIIAGTLFQILQYSYIHSQIGVSKYNAIYGSFAAFPLFLLWLQISWLIVMFGSELSFAAQNVRSFEFDSDTRTISHNYKRVVALLISHRVISDFVQEKNAPTAEDLSYDLKLPIRLVNDILYDLVNVRVVSEIGVSKDKSIKYQPGKDINQLTIMNIIQSLEDYGSSDFHFEESSTLTEIRRLLLKMQSRLSHFPEDCLLKDI